ncbi:hypothetical protein FRB93_012875 [Tulasnella sp. JGI-2019a]|nr:hypothetical protein FRB93_012875 [Tulasnella sp. JGI-2019a]
MYRPSNSTNAANTVPALVNLSRAYDHPENDNNSENLPMELFMKIFGYASGLCGQYYMDIQSAGRYVPRLRTIALVCRRWRAIIMGAAGL